MDNPRTYGEPPFRIAVVHGGPGAPGTMAPVARELSTVVGVLEPLQMASSLEGQVTELASTLERSATLPVTLIGWSWGAWLSVITATRYPGLARKLILVGSGPFEARYAEGILATRLSRLSGEEQGEYSTLIDQLGSPARGDTGGSLARLGELLTKTDAYDPMVLDTEPSLALPGQDAIYRQVWAEASELRRSGRLLALAKGVDCPVLAIHGDYDPHPYEGVRDPLTRDVQAFRLILLEKCGHEPWAERHARDQFFAILKGNV